MEENKNKMTNKETKIRAIELAIESKLNVTAEILIENAKIIENYITEESDKEFPLHMNSDELENFIVYEEDLTIQEILDTFSGYLNSKDKKQLEKWAEDIIKESEFNIKSTAEELLNEKADAFNEEVNEYLESQLKEKQQLEVEVLHFYSFLKDYVEQHNPEIIYKFVPLDSKTRINEDIKYRALREILGKYENQFNVATY